MKYFCLYILLLGFSVSSYSQDYQVQFLDLSDGLSNNSVITSYQDRDGYMWFGTYDGLNRYDGYNFKVYRNKINDKKSLSFNTIYSIEGDLKNNIWVAGSNGACVFDRRKSIFHSLESVSETNKTQPLKGVIHQIRSISEKLVLVASQNSGLLIFENGSLLGKEVALKMQNNIALKYGYDAKVLADDSVSITNPNSN